ncbi:hypothetical protein [Microvirga lotononidis]|uniref:Uncharacterized protein n=1 Tax=Microvirga lotononidis TaxID=864069 RepID=I4YPX2_9HYPH|nr:hypothetical protein [Microvirga lotononidis]EIM26014.1 hypothetical protein MicloDRAFT_00067440 [Microvirga lotononidis]WQO25922.1 hypothetical protein U0023_14525 [Microvirga lotononidis]
MKTLRDRNLRRYIFNACIVSAGLACLLAQYVPGSDWVAGSVAVLSAVIAIGVLVTRSSEQHVQAEGSVEATDYTDAQGLVRQRWASLIAERYWSDTYNAFLDHPKKPDLVWGERLITRLDQGRRSNMVVLKKEILRRKDPLKHKGDDTSNQLNFGSMTVEIIGDELKVRMRGTRKISTPLVEAGEAEASYQNARVLH